MLLEDLNVLFWINAYNHHRVVYNLCQGHWYSPIPLQRQFFGLVVNSLDGPFVFYHEHMTPISSKKRSGGQFVWPQYTFSLQWPKPDVSEPRGVNIISGQGLCKASFLHSKVFVNGAPNCSVWHCPSGYIHYWCSAICGIRDKACLASAYTLALYPPKFFELFNT